MMIRLTLGAIVLAATTLFGAALPWGERVVGVPSAGAGVYLTAEVATGRIRCTVSATGTLEAVTTVEVLTGAPTAVDPRITAAADVCEARESTGVGRK